MGASTGEMDGGTGAFHCTIQIEVLSFGLASQRLPGESEMALLQNQKRRRRSSPKIPLTGRTVVRDRMTEFFCRRHCLKRFRATNSRFAGRSAKRRIRYGYHSVPNGT